MIEKTTRLWPTRISMAYAEREREDKGRETQNDTKNTKRKREGERR